MPVDNRTSAISLREFNNRIKRALSDRSLQGCWICADLSDVAVRGGHCYCELIEKDSSGNTVAKVRGIIWATRFYELRAKFLSVTGQDLHSGIKVMVEVSVNFHEQYGISLIITDIDPTYTIGDMERQRREILRKLKSEGIIDLNKMLAFPKMPQRIAVISSGSAAGYGDFMNQLQSNAYNLQFYTCLYPATMQGQSTGPSVTAALDRIYQNCDLYDCVVIIRGGGATSDLNSFDDYSLAANVAQFPLPVVVGIGHERDVTVLDYVACRRVKTPTAAAELLISCGVEALSHIDDLRNCVISTVSEYLNESNRQLQYLSGRIPLIANNILQLNDSKLTNLISLMPIATQSRIKSSADQLSYLATLIRQASKQTIERETMRVASLNDKVQILSPKNTLKRGYSLTSKNGKIITDISNLEDGDIITTEFFNGKVYSQIKNNSNN